MLVQAANQACIGHHACCFNLQYHASSMQHVTSMSVWLLNQSCPPVGAHSCANRIQGYKEHGMFKTLVLTFPNMDIAFWYTSWYAFTCRHSFILFLITPDCCKISSCKMTYRPHHCLLAAFFSCNCIASGSLTVVYLLAVFSNCYSKWVALLP